MRSPQTEVAAAAVDANDLLDQRCHAMLARATRALSPVSPALAFADWAWHLSLSPGRCLSLVGSAQRKGRDWLDYSFASAQSAWTAQVPEAVQPDRRFASADWQRYPFGPLQQAFVLLEQWWSEATQQVWGLERHHEALVSFWSRQLLDMLSPANLALSNPEVLRLSAQQSGQNLLRGLGHAWEDLSRHWQGQERPAASGYRPGLELACTPGQVVWRNELMELIQYAPVTAEVCPEPVLFVPAWIMKYYILDLQPGSSLIEYLVARGHTVFAISWRNPGPQQADWDMQDYLEQGVETALSVIGRIVPEQQVHGVGYCLGGTLLSIAAAAQAREGRQALATLSLFATQTDFADPGELGLFIDESQLSLLEAQMSEQGCLRADQMAGAFQMLRSYELLWSQKVKEYLEGERPVLNALMAWNADATRMPARMHADYLRSLFLRNDLAEGRYRVDGHAVSLNDIHQPVFLLGTESDHVAPWRSVYKLRHLCAADVRFVLTSGGHNAGVVNPPGQGHRHYRSDLAQPTAAYLAPDEWLAAQAPQDGSWWPAWADWLRVHSAAAVAPPTLGCSSCPVLDAAPGHYVLES